MKIKNLLPALISLLAPTFAFAHCPARLPEEKVCFMLEDNMLYIYDEKLEHNGPYKDLEQAEVSSFKTADGKKIDYKKLARGIYKFQSTEKYKNIELAVVINKKIKTIKVAHE